MAKGATEYWVLLVLLAFVAGGLTGNLTATSKKNEIQEQIYRLEGELTARGKFIAHLQEQIEYANAKATWLLKKIDKRRVLIPVLGGRAYKIVEVENDFDGQDRPFGEHGKCSGSP